LKITLEYYLKNQKFETKLKANYNNFKNPNIHHSPQPPPSPWPSPGCVERITAVRRLTRLTLSSFSYLLLLCYLPSTPEKIIVNSGLLAPSPTRRRPAKGSGFRTLVDLRTRAPRSRILHGLRPVLSPLESSSPLLSSGPVSLRSTRCVRRG